MNNACPNATIYDTGVPKYNYDMVGFDIYCIIGFNNSIIWDETAFLKGQVISNETNNEKNTH